MQQFPRPSPPCFTPMQVGYTLAYNAPPSPCMGWPSQAFGTPSAIQSAQQLASEAREVKRQRTSALKWCSINTSKVPESVLRTHDPVHQQRETASRPQSAMQVETPAAAPVTASGAPHRKAPTRVDDEDLPAPWRKVIVTEGARADGQGREWGVERCLEGGVCVVAPEVRAHPPVAARVPVRWSK